MTPEQRIERLERENRLFRRGGTVVLVTAFVALAVGIGLLATSRAGAENTPKPGVSTATAFRLVDTAGVTRAVLAMERGNPVLRFLGEKARRASSARQSVCRSTARSSSSPATTASRARASASAARDRVWPWPTRPATRASC